MAECEICKKDMLKSDGCNIEDIMIDGKLYERIKVGDVNDFSEGIEDPEFKCHDCGAKTGHYHHWNCDAERCPACNQQLISCDCQDVFIDEFENEADSIEYDNNKKKIEEINLTLDEQRKLLEKKLKEENINGVILD